MKQEIPAILASDSYKQSHRNQYRKGTEVVYSTWTPRKSRIEGIDKVMTFGIQYFIKDYLIDSFNKTFFNRPKEEVIAEFKRVMTNYTGEPETSHWEALHDLGYLPLKISALDEGTMCPIRVPMLTIENTLPEFYWLTNFVETIMSTEIWKPMTSATIAYQYRKIVEKWADKTCDNKDHIPYQGHDFSLRGMAGLDGGMTSGAGHLTCFKGTDTIPAIMFLETYYNADSSKEQIASSIPASEHSVQEANILSMSPGDIQEGEYLNLKHYLEDVYPTGMFSYVADTYNLWNFLTDTLPRCKKEIMNRDGRMVCRPDCYTEDTEILTNQGFKLFKNLEKDDLVAQYTEDGNIEFVQPQRYIDETYEGPMYNFQNAMNHVNITVTPNHRMVTQTGTGTLHIDFAKDLSNTKCRYFINAGLKQGMVDHLTPFDKLMIALQADGRCKTCYEREGDKEKVQHILEFQFAKQRKIDKLISICEEGGYKYKITKPVSRQYADEDKWNAQTTVTVYISNQPYKEFINWVNIEDKSYLWCREFISEVTNWDACVRTESRFKYDTTIEQNAKIVQTIAILAGYRTKFSIYRDNRSEKYHDVYTVNIVTKTNTTSGQAVVRTRVDYKGHIYCVTVPSGMLVVRRDNQVVVSGNSGKISDVLCGLNTLESKEAKDKAVSELVNSHMDMTQHLDQADKGVIELLWDVFGGTVNSKGYKVLDPHVGCIYGDSVTLEIADEVCRRLASKGFASSNIVFGIGSYTYNYNTRDTFGFALKATYGVVNGQEVQLFKDPITDDGTKKSQKGMVAVIEGEHGLELIDHLDSTTVGSYKGENLLTPVFVDGKLVKETSLSEIRARVEENIKEDLYGKVTA